MRLRRNQSRYAPYDIEHAHYGRRTQGNMQAKLSTPANYHLAFSTMDEIYRFAIMLGIVHMLDEEEGETGCKRECEVGTGA